MMDSRPPCIPVPKEDSYWGFSKGVVPLDESDLDGTGLNILIVHTRWNMQIVEALVSEAIATLLKLRVKESNIIVHTVPGAYELPFASKTLIESTKPDVCIPIGVLIKGQTSHFEYISDSVSHGLMRVGLDTGIPVIFGVLTCLTQDQALERAGMGKGDKVGHNHGCDWAEAAVEMALLNRRARVSK